MALFSEQAEGTVADANALIKVKQDITSGLVRQYSWLQKQDNLALLEQTVALVLSTPRGLTWQQAATDTKKEAVTLGYQGSHWVNHIMRVAKEFYSDFSPTTAINYLNLDEEDVRLSWGESYDIKVAKMMARRGVPLREEANSYGWEDHAFVPHFWPGDNQCYIAEVTSLEEDEWDEFEDTFTDTYGHLGVQAEAQCACGWFRGKIRVEGTLGDLISSL